MWSRVVLLCCLCSFAAAQSSKAPAPAVNNDFVHQQFGDSCSLESQWAPVTGDLNGDGIEDIVIVARCKNPLIDQDEKNYKVIDPMNAFFGYGNPAITSTFASEDPKLRGIALLIIHGADPGAWHAPTPQAKFLVINLPVKTIALKKLKRRKKSVTAIYLEEATGAETLSAIYWDGKKYRYEPRGSSME